MQCIAPWIPAFKSGLSQESDGFVSFSFASIDAKKLVPHVRTCVYRDFLFNDESTNSIIFTTDARSMKYDELLHNNNVEACFYFKKSNKQFRLNGNAKVISLNQDLYPNITLPDLANKPYEEESDGEEKLADEDDYEADPEVIGHPVLHKSNSTLLVFQQSTINSGHQHHLHHDNDNNNDIVKIPSRSPSTTDTAGEINAPLNYPLFSPSSMEKIQKELESNSLYSLNELLINKPEILYPPTTEEYKSEFQRAWDLLSSKSKSSFKQPKPRTIMTEAKRKLIDRISRGVDGKSIDEGKKEMAVIIILVNKVDYYKDSYGNSKRLIYERVNFDQWKESEVVP